MLAKLDLMETSPVVRDYYDQMMKDSFINILDVFNEGIFCVSVQNEMSFMNPNFYRQFGLGTEFAHIQDWLALVHPDERDVLAGEIHKLLENQVSRITNQYRVRHLSGHYIWIEGTAILKQQNGKRFILGSHRNISAQKMMEEYLRQAALTDVPSGLANQSKLTIELERLARQEESDYALIYIQNDEMRFYLNHYDTKLLKRMLNFLLRTLNDLPYEVSELYRLRTEDFALLVKGDLCDDELLSLGRHIMSNYQESLSANNLAYGKDISVGIYPRVDRKLSPEEVIKIAARTCQFGRERNSHRLEIYSSDTRRKVERFFFIEQGLKSAIVNGELNVKFQPIVDAQSQQVASFEALVRWRSKTFGEIYPDEFIPVAEKKGLIVDLGYVVFEKACKFIHRYHLMHNCDVKVNVNVSVVQLLTPQFPEQVNNIATRANVPTRNIVLELTETVILDNNEYARRQLKELKQYGFNLSLDDFGAGYSSLNSFFELPLSQIKIDKALAWHSLKHRVSFDYLEFITQLCRTNGVDVVIEGIEDAQMQKTFAEMGATYLQGYWFSKPLSIASASQFTL
ncbi:hypothetical protein VPR01S_05_01250 [Vibrio proteolyticus NBRC 13287]|uniref:Signaling protein n=2 Tax=Vibrionaceae TaxID=641 RepID=U2ZZJ3_VIBPR|nr:hypothetical protein VPR01S_05_01250 [Vibrio proteolyticus NBRC 13287]